MKLRRLYCHLRLLKREPTADVLSTGVDVGTALREQGVEDLFRQPG